RWRMRRTESRLPGSSSPTSTVSRSSGAPTSDRPSKSGDESPVAALVHEDDAVDAHELPPFRGAREGELVAGGEAVLDVDASAIEFVERTDVAAEALVLDLGEALLELLAKPPLVVVVGGIPRRPGILEEVVAGQIEDALDVAVFDRPPILLDHQEDGAVLLGVLDLGVSDVTRGAADRHRQQDERRREGADGWVRQRKSPPGHGTAVRGLQ